MSSDCYDFIIVGAGSAGCVLADRLTACGRYKVLLVEAGGTDNLFWIKVPLGYAKTFHDARVNWRYTAAADPGLNGRRAYWPRGRVIGGSSSINAMAYLRGLPHDFDDWAAAGATGWGWDTARQIYETLETQSELTKGGARRLKGSGPLWVSEVSDRMHPFSGYFLQAAQDMGWPLSQNLNSDQTEGVMRLRSTAKGSRRWSAADAFLRPAMTRKNLRVISCAHVEKVLIKDRVAQGIRYRIGDTLHEARAAKEVILSAGAVNSPQLLQLSGVGPADLLRRHQIKVHHALPQVGQGLQDHLGISYFFRAAEPTLNNILGNWLGKAQAGLHYLLTQKGPLSVPVNQVSGFVRSSPDVRAADMQIYCNPLSYRMAKTGHPDIDPRAGFLLCAQPCRPTSRGTVSIVSANPWDAPDIQPNSLATEQDRAEAIRACQILRQLAQTPTLRSVTKTRLAPDVTTLSDAEMLADFRARAGTIFHPSCTCRMGHSSADSVLDARLRVHGMGGLRVVDASAFPNITSGNINAPVQMLAARAAALILQDAPSTSYKMAAE